LVKKCASEGQRIEALGEVFGMVSLREEEEGITAW